MYQFLNDNDFFDILNEGQSEIASQRSDHPQLLFPKSSVGNTAYKTSEPSEYSVPGPSFTSPTAVFPSFSRSIPLTDTYLLQQNKAADTRGLRGIFGLDVGPPYTRSASIHDGVPSGHGLESPSKSSSLETSLSSRHGIIESRCSTPISARHISSHSDGRSQGSGSSVMHPVPDSELHASFLDDMDKLLVAVNEEMAVGDVKHSVQVAVRARLQKVFKENQFRRDAKQAEELASLRRELGLMRDDLQKQRDYFTDIVETVVNVSGFGFGVL